MPSERRASAGSDRGRKRRAPSSRSYVPNISASGQKKQRATKKTQSKFLSSLRHKATLPQAQFPLKMLVHPHAKEDIDRCCGSTIDAKRGFRARAGPLGGALTDLVDRDKYQRPKGGRRQLIEAKDQRIVDPPRKRRRDKGYVGGLALPWLRKQNFMDNRLYDQTNRQVNAADEFRENEARVKEGREQRLKGETREAQIARIEASFRLVSQPLKHPLKPHLKATNIVEVVPIGKPACERSYTWFSFPDSANYVDSEGKLKRQDILLRCVTSERSAVYAKSDTDTGRRFAWRREYQRVPTRASRPNHVVFVVSPEGNQAQYLSYDRRVKTNPRAMDRRLSDELERRPAAIQLAAPAPSAA